MVPRTTQRKVTLQGTLLFGQLRWQAIPFGIRLQALPDEGVGREINKERCPNGHLSLFGLKNAIAHLHPLEVACNAAHIHFP